MTIVTNQGLEEGSCTSHVHARVSACVYTCLNVFVFVCLCVCVFVCLCVCVFVFVFVFVCLCVCVCVCVFVYLCKYYVCMHVM